MQQSICAITSNMENQNNMKNTFRKITKAFFIITATFLISSCGYEPVFYGIMHDVVPEEATVNGNIISIARCSIDGTEYLFLTGDGALKYKKLTSSTHGDWNTYSNIPFQLHRYNYYPTSENPNEGHLGQQILKVISDKDYIYLLTASYKTDTEYGIVLPDQFYLWAKPLADIFNNNKNDEGWKNGWYNISAGHEDELFKHTYKTDQEQYYTYFNLFSTNTPMPEHRKAFFRVINPSDSSVAYYILNGTATVPPAASDLSSSNFLATQKGNTKINSAFYIGDTLYFSDCFTVITNETSEKPATYACLAQVDSYYNATKNLLIFEDGTSLTDGASSLLELSAPISALALTADSILIGEGSYNSSYTSNGGIEKINLDAEGKPKNETAVFTNNATYQFTSSYLIFTLLCADPSKKEAEACLYATISFRGSSSSSSATSANVGLWAYYPGRGNWNRE